MTKDSTKSKHILEILIECLTVNQITVPDAIMGMTCLITANFTERNDRKGLETICQEMLRCFDRVNKKDSI